MQIAFKHKTRLGNTFHFNDLIPKGLTSGVAFMFQCGFCNESYYGECVTHLDVRIFDHKSISPLNKKLVLWRFWYSGP